jgi:(5-formylfuran-3-yl)methyl phosphate synthase
MRLLVSVRSADEVEAAIAGGADIIDAKEPNRGSLGPVSPDVLGEILRRVPASLDVSAALGDFADPDQVRNAIAQLPPMRGPKPVYLKLGFAGISNVRQIQVLLQEACAAAKAVPHPGARIIAVAYGDSGPAGTVAAELVGEAAVRAGAAGILVDTHSKSSGHLFAQIDRDRLRSLINDIRAGGLQTAIAGGLGIRQLEAAKWAAPDVVGFRGAACIGGRQGRISRSKVQVLKQVLTHSSSAFLQEAELPR